MNYDGGFNLGGMGGMGGGGGGGFEGFGMGGFGSSGENDYNRAFDIDSKLYQLAAYKTTGGLLPDMTTPEEILEYQNKVTATFNHFKRRIQIGSYDFDFIKKQVLNENGPFKNQEISIDEDIENILEEGERSERIESSKAIYESVKGEARSEDVLDNLQSSFRNLMRDKKDKKDKKDRIGSALGEPDESNELDEDSTDQLDNSAEDKPKD
jgi:hypothetical protein